MSSNKMFGRNLKIERKKRNITQSELSEKIGVSRKTLSSYEKGKIQNISFKTVDLLCNELNLSFDSLFKAV